MIRQPPAGTEEELLILVYLQMTEFLLEHKPRAQIWPYSDSDTYKFTGKFKRTNLKTDKGVLMGNSPDSETVH